MTDLIKAVTEDTFENEVLKAKGHVLVDYWAEWCGPCRMIAPTLEVVATEMEGRLKIVKLNIDEAPSLPQRYGVRGIPTLMVFSGGEVQGTKVGALSKAQLTTWLDSVL